MSIIKINPSSKYFESINSVAVTVFLYVYLQYMSPYLDLELFITLSKWISEDLYEL